MNCYKLTKIIYKNRLLNVQKQKSLAKISIDKTLK